ncbi:MAG: hypothetical protein KA712_14775 [Myxococcales bacterium]|nr:hypothetical protein [Myxococcales bacterium]
MKGPLFSGAVGHRHTLERLDALARGRGAVVVLSNIWLAAALCAGGPVHLVVEARRQRTALRARRRAERLGHTLTVSLAAEALPFRPRALGALIVDDLAELASDELHDFVRSLLPFIAEAGLLLSLDSTKEPRVESRIAGAFLAFGLVGLGQERPREGALLTLGASAAEPVVRTLAAVYDQAERAAL